MSAGLGSKDVREVVYMEESCPSPGMVQSGTRAHETALTQDTLVRSKAPLEGSYGCVHIHVHGTIVRRPLPLQPLRELSGLTACHQIVISKYISHYCIVYSYEVGQPLL